MSYDLEPVNQGYDKGKTIEEELNRIRKLKFKFGCLGINCLVWVLILLLILIVYLIKK